MTSFWGPQGACSVSKRPQGTRPAAKRPSRLRSGPRRVAASRRLGRAPLQPSHRLLPSPSPSRRVRGQALRAHGSSRRRRGGARCRESQGCARRAGDRRSARAGSRWGSARSRRPASPRCSGPAAAASTRQRAAPPWPPPPRALHTRAQLPKRARAAVASRRTRGLQGGGREWLGPLPGLGLLEIQYTTTPPQLLQPGTPPASARAVLAPGLIASPWQFWGRDLLVGTPKRAVMGTKGKGRGNGGVGGRGKETP